MSDQQGGSRLQKLLRLIDSGSSLDTRRAAAEQIAAIVASHPAQLPSVVTQVSKHLRHKEWDARVASGYCLGKIAEHVSHHTPSSLAAAAGIKITPSQAAVPVKQDPESKTAHHLLAFATFDVATVISQGTPLLASAGQEFDVASGASRADTLSQQRTNLKKRLGLDGAADEFINTSEFLADEDFLAPSIVAAAAAVKKEAQAEEKKGATELLANMGGMSARERAAAARKAKAAKRKGPVGNDSSSAGGGGGGGGSISTDAPASKRPKTEGGGPELDSNLDIETLDTQWQSILSGSWPFQQLCDQLCVDLLNPLWEVRHGAALALRDILSSQAGSAGVIAPLADPPGGWTASGGSGAAQLGPVSEVDVAAAAAGNASWLEDCAIHMLCTLALDRFGDYVSDQVVAPVRETAAQALGTVARCLSRAVLLQLLGALQTLAECSEWEARHGGLQGLKYALAAQTEVDSELLTAALPSSIAGLKDKDDDVRAVAAEALLPAAQVLAHDTSPAASHALSLVWDALLVDDELSPAVKGASSLLAAVFSVADNNAASVLGSTGNGTASSLGSLIPRLWPHFRHNLSSVRLSSVQCFASVVQSQPVHIILPGSNLSSALRLIFQNFLLEKDVRVLEQSQRAWKELVTRTQPAELAAVLQGIALESMWALSCTPPHRKFDLKLFYSVENAPEVPHVVPGGDGEAQSERATRTRLIAATAFGELAHSLGPAAETVLVPSIKSALQSTAASARVVGGYTVAKWAQLAVQDSTAEVSPAVRAVADEALAVLGAAPPIFEEHAATYALLRRQAAALVEVAAKHSVALMLPCVAELIGPDAALAALAPIAAVPNAPDAVKLAAHAVQTTAAGLQTKEAVLRTTAAGALSAAVVHAKQLPAKLNSLIQPLVASVRREPEPLLQDEAALTLAKLAVACISRSPSPTEKIVKNICGFACGDPAAVPNAASPPNLGEEEVQEQQQSGKGKGKAAANNSKNGGAEASANDHVLQAAALTRRGGEAMLRALAKECGPHLPTFVPGLWNQHIAAAITTAAQNPQAAVEGLRTLEVLAPALHAEVVPATLSMMPSIANCLAHANGAVQLSAARALAALAAAHAVAVMPKALETISPLLAAGAADSSRLGAVVAMRETVSALGISMVPYVQLAVVPLLGRMSDPTPATRAVASSCFATVVSLMPLAQGVASPPGLSPEQEATLAKEGRFLQQLLDNRQMDDFKLPFNLLTGTLRRYQQEGINWLAFLRQFGLHGVLADDMGLGKTLQATSIVAAASIEAREKYRSTRLAADAPRPSLIVCPATLVAHWPHEINKFVDPSVLRPLQYHGVPAARAALRPLLSSHDVVVMSYEALRADVDWVAGINWMYCVLDEGHAIRNPSSKIAQAARKVNAQHRLILSGTPIQNSVIEMWALFDFLMPGFLGGERAFNSRYGKALAASRGAKRGSAEAEAGVLALDSLHRQVMPFVLRRTKDQVLQDLPPKTVQDVICEPGDLQRVLYEDFSASQAMTAVVGAVQTGSLAAGGGGGGSSSSAASGGAAPPHVFQALHYLRKLCSHPLLVLDPEVPAHMKALTQVLGPKIGGDWALAQQHLKFNLAHSPKLAALRELLVDCGIGTEATGDKAVKEEAAMAADAGHRALVFAQTRALLDLADETVLKPMGIDSLRIDGSVEASERFRRVQRFNADPTVEVMLLTTAVGGLGLNLTAADTVIFLEHDWNPQKDLQAMDRAHRLGQRRAVNVYRLLVKGTLEEQVMSLQKFKLDVAAAVVNAENMSLQAMDTGNLLDLFALQEDEKKKPGAAQGGAAESAAAAAAAGVGGGGRGGGLAAVLAGLTDPAAVEAQYGEEFDLASFKEKLLGKKAS